MPYIRVTISMKKKVYDKLIAIRAKRIAKGDNVSFTQIVNEHLENAIK